MIKEKFFVFTAQRVEICAKGSISGDEWLEKNFEKLEKILAEAGFDINAAGDMLPLFNENKVVFFFINDEHQIHIGTRDFRGYVMDKGTSFIPSSIIVGAINNEDIYGHSDFDEKSAFKIEEVIHDDTTDTINYYLRCFVEIVKPIELHM